MMAIKQCCCAVGSSCHLEAALREPKPAVGTSFVPKMFLFNCTHLARLGDVLISIWTGSPGSGGPPLVPRRDRGGCFMKWVGGGGPWLGDPPNPSNKQHGM
jgi:hypothetical protein